MSVTFFQPPNKQIQVKIRWFASPDFAPFCKIPQNSEEQQVELEPRTIAPTLRQILMNTPNFQIVSWSTWAANSVMNWQANSRLLLASGKPVQYFFHQKY